MRNKGKVNIVSGQTEIDYRPLMHILVDNKMSRGDLRKELGLTTSTILCISTGKPMPMEAVLRICRRFGCDINDILKIKSFSRENSAIEKVALAI